MKKSMNPLKFFIITILFATFSCNGDLPDKEDSPGTIEFKGESYGVAGYLLAANDSIENAVKISIWRSDPPVIENDSIVSEPESFGLEIILVPSNNSTITGSYSMGDQNGDGITNKYDAFDAGYCNGVTFYFGYTYSFVTGDIELERTTLKFPYNDMYGNSLESGYDIRFSLKDAEGRLLTGEVEIADARDEY